MCKSVSRREMCMFLQKELHFDDELVLQQIKHTGLLQIVHIQKSGYSAKYSFKVGSRLVKRMFFSICRMFFHHYRLFGIQKSVNTKYAVVCIQNLN